MVGAKDESLEFFHLPYPGDASLFYEVDFDQIHYLRCILLQLEMVSGNLEKTRLTIVKNLELAIEFGVHSRY